MTTASVLHEKLHEEVRSHNWQLGGDGHLGQKETLLSFCLDFFQPHSELLFGPSLIWHQLPGKWSEIFWELNVQGESFLGRINPFIYLLPTLKAFKDCSDSLFFFFLKVFLFISRTSNSCLIIISLISIKESWQLQNIWGRVVGGWACWGMRKQAERNREKSGLLRAGSSANAFGWHSERPASQPYCNTVPWHYFQKAPRALKENGMKSLQLK